MTPGTDTTELNLRGLKCPLPALKVRKALASMLPGARVSVTCTDPMSMIDIPNLVAQTGDLIRDQLADAGEYRFVLEKAAPSP